MGIAQDQLYGYGNGFGNGFGYGNGFGDDMEVVERYLYDAAGELEEGCEPAFWKSNADGTPANGGGGPPRHAGMVEEIKGPLQICTSNALHATLQLGQWYGEKIWIVAMYPPIVKQSDKWGSLKRKIIKEFC